MIEPAAELDTSIHATSNRRGFLYASALGLYDRGRWLWRELEFALEPGERLALSGPSGSGKTTLLRCLAGLIPVTEGEIYFQNRPLSNWPMPGYRTHVGYLQQRPMLGDGDTVEAVLTQPFGYRAHRASQYPRAQVSIQLELLGRNEGFLQRPIDSLSGGEQQIVALLRLLAVRPSLLLLDEPTASLDRKTSQAVESLIDGWLDRRPESALLWVGHDPEQAARMADRQLELKWNP